MQTQKCTRRWSRSAPAAGGLSSLTMTSSATSRDGRERSSRNVHAQKCCHAITVVVSLEPSSASPSSLVSSSAPPASACDTASLSSRRDTSSLHSGSPPTGSLAAPEQSSAGGCAPGTGKFRSLACAFVASTTASRAAPKQSHTGQISKTWRARVTAAVGMGQTYLSRSAAEQPSAPSAAWPPRTSAAGPQAAGPASRRGM